MPGPSMGKVASISARTASALGRSTSPRTCATGAGSRRSMVTLALFTSPSGLTSRLGRRGACPSEVCPNLEPDAFTAAGASFDAPVIRESLQQAQAVATMAAGAGWLDDLRHRVGFVAHLHTQPRDLAVAPGQVDVDRRPGIEHCVGDELAREELGDFREDVRVP